MTELHPPPPDGVPDPRPALAGALLRRLALVASVVAGGIVAGAVGTASTVGILNGFDPLPSPDPASLERRTAVVRAFDDLALPTASEPSPRRIGEMVTGLRHEGAAIRARCEEAPRSSPVAGSRGWPCLDHTAVFPAAARGLSDAERRHVRRFLDDPGLPVIEALARARGYDPPLAARGPGGSKGPPGDMWDLAVPSLGPLRRAAWVKVAEAGLRFAEGESAAAETALLELVSAGRRVALDGRTVVEALVGAAIMRAGLKGLVLLYEASGRGSEAARIAHGLADDGDRVRPAGSEGRPGGPAGGDTAPSPGARLRRLEDRVADPSLVRGLAFEYALLSVLGRSCVGPRAVLLGPPARHDAVVEALRRRRRYPTDDRLLDLLVSSVEDLHERSGPGSPGWHGWGADPPWWASWAALPVEMSAWLLRNPRVDGCFELRMMRY